MQKLGRYELLTQIAKGGMAEIWVARARSPSRGHRAGAVCVVKRLLPQHAHNDEFIKMFLDEGRLAAALDHPNVVQMFDFGSEGGTHYLAMEYLHGEDLRTVLRTLRSEGKPMALGTALYIVAGCCAGLHAAHEAKNADGVPLEIVHRDVSPHNVFLTFDGGVKVVDFGIAKSLDRRWETKHGTIKGKVPYMSPEQIKGRRLDRRSDIYALGVLLYEMVLGRRPYVLSNGGDFAMMMAIARHDVRAPSLVDPKFPPELERIITTAMAYDPRNRYGTAEEMKAAIEKFARAHAASTFSPKALSAFMGKMFGSRVEQWRAALQEADALAAMAVQIEEERAASGTIEDDDTHVLTEVSEGTSTMSKSRSVTSVPPMPPQSSAALVASNSPVIAGVAELFGMTVVTFQGKLDETFDGRALAGSVTGTLLLDLKGVERVTSFGVREWLEMMATLDEDLEIWLARCSEAIVTQLSLMRNFCGPARIASFQAPFLCNDCGSTSTRTLDCELDAAMIRGELPATSKCPRCGGVAPLDDDPSYFAFAQPFAGAVLPERVRMLLGAIEDRDRSAADVVDKLVTETETRLRVHRDVDSQFRWKRVLDGIEGSLVIDFRGLPAMKPETASSLVRALLALGREVTSCELLEAPVTVARALGAQATGASRIRVGSVVFSGRCNACAAPRSGVVPHRELERAWQERRPPIVSCRRCNAPLTLADVDAVQQALFAVRRPTAESAPSASLAVTCDAEPESVRAAAETARSPSVPPKLSPRAVGWGAKLGVAAAAVATAGILIGVSIVRSLERPSAPARTETTSATGPAPVAGPTLERRADGVYVVVTARANDAAAALARARADAVAAIVREIERGLQDSVREAQATLPATTDAELIAERYGRHAGAFASPERIDVRLDHEGGSAVLTALYHLDSEAFARAQTYYSETREAFGMTFAPVLPSRGDGLVVVDASHVRSKGVEPGALLVSVDGRTVFTTDSLSTMKAARQAVFTVRGAEVKARLDGR
jgi:serine/threonine protein kinase